MTNVQEHDQKQRAEILDRQYPFDVSIDEAGGYVVEFPDLPGCVTQVDSLADLPEAANEIRTIWIETALDYGQEIPNPSMPQAYSGKFNVRLPRSLHKSLVESAAREGVSLNQHVVAILSAGSKVAQIEDRLRKIEDMLQPASAPAPPAEVMEPEPSMANS